jgi:hypothetical protein
MVKLNPELEVVTTDDEAETITIRNKSTGEEMTVDWSRVEEGRIIFGSEGKEMTVGASEGDEGGTFTVKSSDGEEVRMGSGDAADIPAWVPLHAGAEPVSTFSMTSADGSSGALTATFDGSVQEAVETYEQLLTGAGYEVSKNVFTVQGEQGAMLTGASEADGRSLNLMISTEEGDTQVAVTYSEEG